MRSVPTDLGRWLIESRWTSRLKAGVTAESGVGVKELSRLISRLRHRQFGILVTTSYLGHQAYEELRSDRHPVL
jgi:Restriction endonuclease